MILWGFLDSLGIFQLLGFFDFLGIFPCSSGFTIDR